MLRRFCFKSNLRGLGESMVAGVVGGAAGAAGAAKCYWAFSYKQSETAAGPMWKFGVYHGPARKTEGGQKRCVSHCFAF